MSMSIRPVAPGHPGGAAREGEGGLFAELDAVEDIVRGGE
jgi:hypothetical protein